MTGDKARPCHRCWQCRRDHVDDWVGRCIAEWKTSAQCLVGTLTYGQDPHYAGVDHRNAHVLFYTDVQKYVKRLRWVTNGKIRYFCAGEYGSKKGRAHWHILLFFQKQLPPDVRYRERYKHEAWPHGWSYFDVPTPEGIRYVAKYVLKDRDHRWMSMYRFSTAPELGHEYFAQLARTYVEQQLPPRLVYSFPEDRTKSGKPREYRLSRAAAFKFLGNYAKHWREQYGTDNWPQSELMDLYCDEVLRRELIVSGQAAIDFDERWALECSDRRASWIYGLGGDGRIVQLFPERLFNRYREASRGV